jgi:hypothetical protein
MFRKKVEVVELNKKEEKIVLEEKQSALILFWRRHRLLIFLTALILSLTIIAIGIIAFIKNAGLSEEPIIKEVAVETSLNDYMANVISNGAMTEADAIDYLKKKGLISGTGEVLLVKTVEKDTYKILYYSDGMAIKYENSGDITKVMALEDGSYGINDEGIISSKAKSSDIKVTKEEEFPWGKVKYYNDGGATVSNADIDIYVRNSADIAKEFISSDKVTYVKDSKTLGNTKITYYYDGTIEVVKGNKSYVLRNEADINISGNDVTFPNNNAGEIIKHSEMADGVVIDYYSDGGAIIRNGTNNISVRKSNSIVIKNNKIYEIVPSKYVNDSKNTDNATFYTNGGSVINYGGKTYYVPENSDILYDEDGNVKEIRGKKEELTNRNNVSGEVLIFEETAVIKTDKYTAIVPADSVVFDKNGKIIDIDSYDEENGVKTFDITNNTNDRLNYRIVIERSKRTTVDTKYLRYQLINKAGYVEPSVLDKKIWPNDNLYKAFGLNSTNYILVDGLLEPYDTDKITLMLWADYDTIPNPQMNKYFYGTIRVYGWTEETKS